MSSQEIHYIKEQTQKGESKEKKALYNQALKFLNSPKIRKLPPQEYNIKVKEVYQILKNKESEGFKRQTSSKIDFLKLSMEIENQKIEAMFKIINSRISNVESSYKDLNKIKNESWLIVRALSSTSKDLETLYNRDKNLLQDELIKYDQRIGKGEIKLNNEQLKKYKKLKNTVEGVGKTQLKMTGKNNQAGRELLRNRNVNIKQRINFILGEKGINLSDLRGMKGLEIDKLLKEKGINQEDRTLILRNIGLFKSEQKAEAKTKIKDKGQLAETERLISQGLSLEEATEQLKKKNKIVPTKNRIIESQEYIPPKKPEIEPRDKILTKKNQELIKSPLNSSIEKQIASSRPLDLGTITSLNIEDRKKAFDMIFENIKNNPSHSKKIITNGIEFDLSGSEGNYQVKYGDRIITGLSREKVKESISFAKFLKPLGLDFLIGYSSKIIDSINKKSIKGLQINDVDGMNILEQDLCLEKLGNAILGKNYKHSTILDENSEQFTKIKSNPIKYNNSSFSNIELLTKTKFSYSGGTELNIDKLLANFS